MVARNAIFQDLHRRQNAVDDLPAIVPHLMAMPVPMRNNFYIDRHLALNMPVFDRKDEFYLSFAPVVYNNIFSPGDRKSFLRKTWIDFYFDC